MSEQEKRFKRLAAWRCGHCGFFYFTEPCDICPACDQEEWESVTLVPDVPDNELTRLRTSLKELVEALRHVAQVHHDNLSPSRLHDPENIEHIEDCSARTCQLAVATLAAAADHLTKGESG